MTTPETSYRAAVYLLDQFWLAYRADFDDDLPVLLGAMTPADDGAPTDAACAADWSTALREAGPGVPALVRFLEGWRARGESESKDISRLLTWIQDFPHSAMQLWQEAEAAAGSPSLQPE